MRPFLSRLAILLITIVGVMVAFIPTSQAYAAVRHQEAILSQQTTTVQRGQIVEDVLVLGHDATISGDVSEILVVIDGDIHLTSTSRAGIVVDLGGQIRQDPGAHVNALYHASLITPFWDGALFGGTMAILIWAGMLAVSIGLVVLSTLICFAFRHQVKTTLNYIERSVRRVGMTGLFMSLVVLAVSALCAVTIIGLPVTGLLIILYVGAGVIGFSIVSLWFGKLAMRYSPKQHPVWILSLIGSSLIVTLSNVPFVGLLLFCIFWLVGLGTITAAIPDIWRATRGRRK